jgi:DNA (cytosine-5)-methyltransferase 1
LSGLTFGSVCSGIEAASVAWHPLGWNAAWLAEIEPFPSAVLAHHYPQVPNLGDMTTIAARVRLGQVAAPDILVGGTPCQAFSVAGLRKSLEDARGQLTLAFVDLANAIDTARSVRGEPPAIVVWENVPGVLSTADNAFGCFLAGLAGEDEALVPPGKKWANAGVVYGPQRTVAWRVTDAQYFGVAQRRRRCFVVASARTDIDPAEIFFVEDGLRRDTPPCRQTREEVTGTISSRTTGGGGLGTDFECGGGLQPVITRPSPQALEVDENGLQVTVGTLCADTHPGAYSGQDAYTGRLVPVVTGPYAFQPRIARNGRGDMGDLVNALTAQAGETGKGDAAPCVAYAIQAGATRTNPASGPDGVGVQEAVAYTLEARAEVQAVAIPYRIHGEHSTAMTGKGNARVADPVEVARALDTCGGYATNQGGNVVLQAVAFSCKDHGADASVEIAPTLRAMGYSGSHANGGGQIAVSFKASHYTRGKDGAPSEVVPPLSADADKGDQDPLVLAPVIFTGDGVVADPLGANEAKTYTNEGSRNFRLHNCVGEPAYFNSYQRTIDDVTAPVMASDAKKVELGVLTGMAVRRLTPRECERLQAFPDDYTLITYRGKAAADGPRYKALGNSMCVNNMRWIGQQIERTLERWRGRKPQDTDPLHAGFFSTRVSSH